MQLEEFKNKSILITGAGKGIGNEIAKQLHEAGANLILHAFSEESIQQLKFKFGERHQYFKADFTLPESIEQIWKEAIELKSPLTGYINCVGLRSRRPIHLLKVRHVQEILCANLVSFLEMVRLVSQKNTFQPGLRIVNISSIASLSGGAGVTAYAASKAGADAAIRCLAKELYKKEIYLNSIVCGQVKTEAYDQLMASKEDQNDKILERQYMGLSKPYEIASIVLFLLSEKSKYINGTAIHADGGYLH
jgi:NAD(P)-dependent dehydrogenase (short-subunit alcohol dehydrogenase family)